MSRGLGGDQSDRMYGWDKVCFDPQNLGDSDFVKPLSYPLLYSMLT